MDLWGWFKANFFPFHFVFGLLFVLSGCLVCFLMFILYLTVWPFNKILYRKLVVHLAYTIWCQFTFLGQWWSGSECTLHMECAEDFKRIGKEHVIVIMNHKYDIDWLMTWILAERLQMLGGTKIYGKSSLKMVPIIGWAWVFTESIFLAREWERDKHTITRDLKHICDYPPDYFITLLLFCEGTRFTEEKHQRSIEFGKAHGLPFLQHHLLPRTKGFTHSIHGLQSKVHTLLDLTIGFLPDSAPPTLMSIIRGRKCSAQLYARLIPIDTIPIETEEATNAWLINHYVQKDKIYEEFVTNGGYVRGTKFVVHRRLLDLVVWVVWFSVLVVPLSFHLIRTLLLSSFYIKLAAIAIVTIGCVIIRKMIAVTETQKTSSTYGSNHAKFT